MKKKHGQKSKIGIIAGNGFESIFGKLPKELVQTPSGSIEILRFETNTKVYYFVPRHGSRRQYPGHKLPSKAYVLAFLMLGVRQVIALSGVGGISNHLKVSNVIIPDQFIDLGAGAVTFCDEPAVHFDMTEPFCDIIGDDLRLKAKNIKLPVVSGGVYVGTRGPRFRNAR